MNNQEDFHIIINGNKIPIKEGYKLHKIITGTNVSFELFDAENISINAFSNELIASDGYENAYKVPGQQGGQNQDFVTQFHSKKIKQMKNKSIKKNHNTKKMK